LTDYLHRKSTFVSEYVVDGYMAPTNAEWEQLQAIIAEMEDKLMSDCLGDLIDAINTQTDVLDVMRQCVCAISNSQGRAAGALPDVNGYVDNEDVTYKSIDESKGSFTDPATDIIRCEYAQSVWYWVYQLYTEKLLPFADATSDRLVAIIVAASTFGALAGFIGVPVAVLSAIVFAVVSWGVESSINDFVNWMLGTKDEIICLLYNSLPDVNAAAAAVSAFIDNASELSYLDKLVLKSVLASSWHYTWIIKDQEVNGTWDDYFVPGQCVLCDAPEPGCIEFGPCNLDDWTGGTLECAYNGVLLGGGTSYWTKETCIPLTDSYMSVTWTPREANWPEGRANFSLRRLADGQSFLVIAGIDHPVDVPVTEYGSIPAACWNQECYFQMQQVSQYVEPHKFCMLDELP